MGSKAVAELLGISSDTVTRDRQEIAARAAVFTEATTGIEPV
jgi:hypothetical protein